MAFIGPGEGEVVRMEDGTPEIPFCLRAITAAWLRPMSST